MNKTKQVRPVPTEFHTVTPHLVTSSASRAIEFYKKAFNAKETSRSKPSDGRILNAQIKIGESIITAMKTKKKKKLWVVLSEVLGY